MHLVGFCVFLLQILVSLPIVFSENKETTIQESKLTKVDTILSDDRPKSGQRNELSRVEHKEKIIETYHHIVKKILPPFEFVPQGKADFFTQKDAGSKAKQSGISKELKSKSRPTSNETKDQDYIRKIEKQFEDGFNETDVGKSKIAKQFEDGFNEIDVGKSQIAKLNKNNLHKKQKSDSDHDKRKSHLLRSSHRASNANNKDKFHPKKLLRTNRQIHNSESVGNNLPHDISQRNLENKSSDAPVDHIPANFKLSNLERDHVLTNPVDKSDNATENEPTQESTDSSHLLMHGDDNLAPINPIPLHIKRNATKKSSTKGNWSNEESNKSGNKTRQSLEGRNDHDKNSTGYKFLNNETQRNLEKLLRMLQYGLDKEDGGFKTKSKRIFKKKLFIFRDLPENQTKSSEETNLESQSATFDVYMWFLGFIGLLIVTGIIIMIVLLVLKRHASRERLTKSWSNLPMSSFKYYTPLKQSKSERHVRLSDEDDMESRLANDTQELNEVVQQIMRDCEFQDKSTLRKMYSTPQHKEQLRNAMSGNIEPL